MKITQQAENEVINSHVFAKNSQYPEKEELKKYVFNEQKTPV